MQTAIHSYTLTALIQMLQDTGKTYLCNAIVTTLKDQGLTSPENMTSALHDAMRKAFPKEFPMNPSRISGVMEFWVTDSLRKQFFLGGDPDYVFGYEELQVCRIAFLNYLIENHGDVKLDLELNFYD
jgi:hypothetical protein